MAAHDAGDVSWSDWSEKRESAPQVSESRSRSSASIRLDDQRSSSFCRAKDGFLEQEETTLGVGSYGTVVTGVYEGAPVAIKVMKYSEDSMREVQIASLFSSLPNVITVHQVKIIPPLTPRTVSSSSSVTIDLSSSSSSCSSSNSASFSSSNSASFSSSSSGFSLRSGNYNQKKDKFRKKTKKREKKGKRKIGGGSLPHLKMRDESEEPIFALPHSSSSSSAAPIERVIQMYMDLKPKTLLDLISERDAPLPNTKIIMIFEQLLSAVSAIHNAGFVHKDIKLENILVDNNQIFLCDFGFAKPFTRGTKGLQDNMGSLHYSPPEIWHMRPYEGPEVDVWALGVCLFLLCTGYFPFGGTNAQEVFESVERREIWFPKELRSRRLRSLLFGMLCYNPEHRITLSEVRSHPYFTASRRAKKLEPNQLHCIATQSVSSFHGLSFKDRIQATNLHASSTGTFPDFNPLADGPSTQQIPAGEDPPLDIATHEIKKHGVLRTFSQFFSLKKKSKEKQHTNKKLQS